MIIQLLVSEDSKDPEALTPNYLLQMKGVPIPPPVLVLVIDETSPRNSWPLCRILEIFPNSKGQIRRVNVKTKSSILERPVSRLCFLGDMS